MITESCDAITQQNLLEWSQPSQDVGGGHDARSSLNGLLAIFYGSVEKSSQFNWLNGGRTLVDKTYLDILLKAVQLPNLGVSSQIMASELDRFVRAELEPIWHEIEHFNHQQKQQCASELIKIAADNIFGSGYQEEYASWLLFYLCPQLPIFPFNKELNKALTLRLHQEKPAEDYEQYSQRCCELYSRMLPKLDVEKPKAEYGDKRDLQSVDAIMRGSDWWQRQVFISQLKK